MDQEEGTRQGEEGTRQQAAGRSRSAPAATAPTERRAVKPFWAHVFDSDSGIEAWNGFVHAADLKQAEQFALAKASLATRDHPALLEVRHLHELCPTCGQAMHGWPERARQRMEREQKRRGA